MITKLTKLMTNELRNDTETLLFCVSLSIRIIINGSEHDIAVPFLKKGYQIATNTILKAFANRHTLAIKNFPWSSNESIVSYIQSLLAKSQCFNFWCSMNKKSALTKLSAKLLESYETVAVHSECKDRDSSTNSVNILYHQMTGLAIDCIHCIHNTIIMELPSSYLNGDELVHSAKFRRSDLVVAMFESSLELPNSTNHYNTVEIHQETSTNNEYNSLSVEKKLLNSIAVTIQRSKVDVVCCQKRIHPYLKRKLLTVGIRTLSNVSVRYMGALLRLSVFDKFYLFKITVNMSNSNDQNNSMKL
mmetsp:Transcript_498/g.832  ORF Transcript_498/g.832 Transcript_498/m.832 type:complete len:303 (-) Transcript_498:882-1790(-)